MQRRKAMRTGVGQRNHLPLLTAEQQDMFADDLRMVRLILNLAAPRGCVPAIFDEPHYAPTISRIWAMIDCSIAVQVSAHCSSVTATGVKEHSIFT